MKPQVTSSYRDYLNLKSILNAEDLRFSVLNEAPVHDETLFIIMHQTVELWFYQALAECREARRLIIQGDIEMACDSLERVGRIFVVLTASWDVLASLKPAEFWQFRKYFGTASGFQSAQFREMEFVLGLRQTATRDLKVHRKLKDSDACRKLDEELETPSLWDEVNRILSRSGFDLPEEIISRKWRTPYPEPDLSEKPAPGKPRVPRTAKGNRAVERAWMRIYTCRTEYPELYRLGERLLDFSAAFSSWRFKHIVTVERFIGGLPGTGKSPGIPYLIETLAKRAFPELWWVRDHFKLLGRSGHES